MNRMYWPWQKMEYVISVLQKKGPYWDRKGGADHIFVITGDRGERTHKRKETDGEGRKGVGCEES